MKARFEFSCCENGSSSASSGRARQRMKSSIVLSQMHLSAPEASAADRRIKTSVRILVAQEYGMVGTVFQDIEKYLAPLRFPAGYTGYAQSAGKR